MLPLIFSTIKDAGSREFMEQLYIKYSKLIYSQVYKLTRDSYEVEEIVQESLVHLIEKVDLLQTLPRDRLVNYLISTARYTGYAFFRKKRKVEEISIEEDEAACFGEGVYQSGLDEVMIQKLESEQLYQVWLRLRKRDQLILNMKYILDLSNETIAETLGVKVGSVRMLLTRAKRNLSLELKNVMTIYSNPIK